MFTADLQAVDQLRHNAVSCTEPHVGGIKRLQAYAAQLVWMGGKFPIDIGADFVWYSALGYDTSSPTSQNNIRFELANVLFNLAVLYCQLATCANRSTAEGLKSACNYFSLSAGVISHLKTTVLPEMRSAAPEDMDPMTLECIELLMLAQCQECFWAKAVKDGLKDASIAKLAAKVSDLYSQASDFGIKSEAISSEWIHHMSAKHHHFAGAAQYRAACDCLEKRKYGEEVARLRDSVSCANEGIKESRYISQTVAGELNGLKSKVEEDLKRAEKDNDLIYLIPVPPKSELKILDRASMATAKIAPQIADPISMLGENGELGKMLFSKLVPYSVHLAASVYSSRRDQTIDGIANEIEALNTRIHDLLRSLKLPGSLQALEKPLGLPPGLVSHAEEIRQHNGNDRLLRTINDVDKLKQNDLITFQEGVGILQAEAAEDDQARRRYGTERWSRLASYSADVKLYERVKEIEGYFKSAEASDAKVRGEVKENKALIQLLNSTDRDLEQYVPSSRKAIMIPRVEKEVTKVRAALNEISRMESRRRRQMESLRSKAEADDINPELLREASRMEREKPMQKIEAAQFEAFFNKRLERYDSDRAIPKQEEREQRELLSRVAEANTCLRTARSGDSSTKDRERALQKLENAYFAYKGAVQSLEVGRKFYNELAPLVNTFRGDCGNFAYQRRSQAAQLEADITTAIPMTNLSLQDQHPIRQSTRRASRDEEPLTAPVPVKPMVPPMVNNSPSTAAAPKVGMWTPDMGIKFGSSTIPSGAMKSDGSGQNTGKDGRWDASRGLSFGQ